MVKAIHLTPEEEERILSAAQQAVEVVKQLEGEPNTEYRTRLDRVFNAAHEEATAAAFRARNQGSSKNI